MITNHSCGWWTNRRLTEVIYQDGGLHGAGVPPEVFELAARSLGKQFETKSDPDDEYGRLIAIGDLANGSTHDDCFFHLEPATEPVKRSLLAAILELHAGYLEAEIDWSGVLDQLAEWWMPDTKLVLRSHLQHRWVTKVKLLLGSHLVPRSLSVLAYDLHDKQEVWSFAETIDCTNKKAVLK